MYVISPGLISALVFRLLVLEQYALVWDIFIHSMHVSGFLLCTNKFSPTQAI